MNGINDARQGNGVGQSMDGLRAESARKDEVIKALSTDLETKEQTIRALELQLASITNGPGWKLLGMIWPIRRRLIPAYSRRERILQGGVHAITVLSQEGVRVFLSKTAAALRQSRHGEKSYVQNPELPSLVLADGAACPQPPLSVVVLLDSREGQPERQSVMVWVASQTLSEVEVATWDRASGHVSTLGERTAENVSDVRALCRWLRGRYICFASTDLLQQRATYLEENLVALESEALAFTVNVRGKADWSNVYFRLGRLPGTLTIADRNHQR